MVTLFTTRGGVKVGIDPGFLIILPFFSIIIALQLPLYACVSPGGLGSV